MKQAIVAFVFLALAGAALFALSRLGPLGTGADASTEQRTASYLAEVEEARAAAEDLRRFVDTALEENRVARRAHSEARLSASRAKDEEQELFSRLSRYEKLLESDLDPEERAKMEEGRDEIRTRLRDVKTLRGESERNADELGRDLERRRERAFALEEGLSHVEGLVASLASMRETAEGNGERTRLDAAVREIKARLQVLEAHREFLRFRTEEGGSLALPPSVRSDGGDLEGADSGAVEGSAGDGSSESGGAAHAVLPPADEES